MTKSLSDIRQEIEAKLLAAEDRHNNLCLNINQQDKALEALLESSPQFQVLGDICLSLDKLAEMDAASLFWGEDYSGSQQENLLSRVSDTITGFQQKVDEINGLKMDLQGQADLKLDTLDDLSYQLDDVLLQQEAEQDDYAIERHDTHLPFHAMHLPWATEQHDQLRFRKSLSAVFVFLLLLNTLIIFWDLPDISDREVVVPEYLVELVKKDKPKPRPVVKKINPKLEQKSDEKNVAKRDDKPKPTPDQKKAARKKAEASGVLAFKGSFEELLADDVDQRLGSSANLSNRASISKGDSSRNLVMAQAKQSSGGINSSDISRGVGGTAGTQMGTGVEFSRVESAIGTDMVADDRPLSDGVGPSRTDEEIQIVFDRYKAALYRIYNRELRKDPTLRGKMVLRITIEPNGSVSLTKVESTNMQSPGLLDGVLQRVARFNFGPKDGVPTITILYPIDFLPAA